MKITEITKNEFDAVCYARNARLMPLLDEVGYYKDEENSLFGVIARDRCDGDFGGLILGRDANKRFRAIELSRKFHETPEEAFVELTVMFEKIHAEGNKVHPQGDEKGKPNELYQIAAKPSKVHSAFKQLANDPTYSPARAFIGEAVYSYVDVDGNYIKDFQSTGFNSRLWELYLYIFLKHQGFEFDNSFHAPDYWAEKNGVTIALEATTVNSDLIFDEPFPLDETAIYRLLHDYMPIKFGSSLYSKLQKKYWALDHVQNRPLIFAVHDYHMSQLLYWSQNALRSYLFGCRYKCKFDNDAIMMERDGDDLPIPEVIARHIFKHKNIPSNFFAQPGAENVSAVLFCNNASLDTFNRYGKLAKLGNHSKTIYRLSELNDLTSATYTPKVVEQMVNDKKYRETWQDTMCIFHNPDAKHPLDPNLFSGITQCFFDRKVNRYFGPRQSPEILRSVNRYE